MRNIFTEHPHSIGETYLQHFIFASRFALGMIIGGLACLLHAIFPFVFKNTGSNYLLSMTQDFAAHMPANEPRIEKLTRTLNSKKRIRVEESIPA